eukprot:5226146-Lingulodinium_polyedra.AAC.1
MGRQRPGDGRGFRRPRNRTWFAGRRSAPASKAYLLALAIVDSQGLSTTVGHGKTVKYYTELLQGGPKAMLRDVEVLPLEAEEEPEADTSSDGELASLVDDDDDPYDNKDGPGLDPESLSGGEAGA